MLKSFLRKFLPTPAESFDRKIVKLEKKLDILFAQLRECKESNLNLLKCITDLQEYVLNSITDSQEAIMSVADSQKAIMSVADSQKTILSKVSSYEKFISSQTMYWDNQYERDSVRANWGIVIDQAEFAEKYINLIRGLDSNSIELITRILLRQKLYLSNNSEKLDLYTKREKEELFSLKEDFYSEILQISDGLYAYKQYLLPKKHFEASVFYYKHGIHDLKTADTVKGKAIIDVGGYIGDSVLVLSELQPSVIHTFEAVPENFKLLQKTIALNNQKNVVAHNLALGAEEGSLVMHVDEPGSGSTSIHRDGPTYVQDIIVPVVPLDNIVELNNLNIGLIKVDIEGGEPAFLKGAKRTICEQKPILLLSIYHNSSDFFSIKPMVESWNLGYTFKIHKPTISNITGETLLIAEVIDQ